MQIDCFFFHIIKNKWIHMFILVINKINLQNKKKNSKWRIITQFLFFFFILLILWFVKFEKIIYFLLLLL